MASHPLDTSNHTLDIQADILRTKKTEVIEGYDARFDRAIYDRFNHKDLIRELEFLCPLLRNRRNKPLASSKQDIEGTLGVVYNLLLNAIKYSVTDPSKFRLEFGFEQEKDNIIVRFQDWGVGIKKEDRDKIFEPGFRSSYAYQYDVNGSGLGLTIARERMREMGGDLRLTNLARPTEFQMIVPLKLTEVPK